MTTNDCNTQPESHTTEDGRLERFKALCKRMDASQAAFLLQYARDLASGRIVPSGDGCVRVVEGGRQ